MSRVLGQSAASAASGSALVVTGGASGGSQALPKRRVFLTTVDKRNPLNRNTREVGRRARPAGETVADAKRRDEDREAVYSCAPYVASINHLLMQMPKGSKHAVELVIERMRTEHIPMDQMTYNLLLEKVVDLRDDIAFRIYEDFKEESQREDSSVRLDIYTFHLMIRACERNGDYPRAFHLYNQMKEQFTLYPDILLYNTLIGYCAPLRDETTASFIVEEMKDRGVELNVHTYNCLMNVFADAPYELILQTFEDMIRQKVRPNRRTYNTLMRACQRVGDYDKAFMFFEELKREGLTPDVVTYNVLIVMCRERLDFVFATGKYAGDRRTKEQKDVGMKAVAELSMSLFAEMEELQILPNTYTYNGLLGVLARCHDLRVYDVLEQMKEDHRSDNQRDVNRRDTDYASWIVENTETMDVSKLLAHSEQGQREFEDDSADGGATRIATRGVKPNLETYSIVIDASERLSLSDKAHALFEEMKTAHIKPDKDVYIKMIGVCSLKSDKPRAFHVFQEAQASGLPLDTDLFNAYLNVLAECSDPEVFTFFSKLMGGDSQRVAVRPTQDTYNILLKACYRLKSWQHAFEIYTDMCQPSSPISPDTVSYGILIDICCLRKDVQRAADLIVQMKLRNVVATINTYCRLMNVFVAANDAGVVEVFNDIRVHGPAPTLEAYTILLSYYLQTNNDAIATSFEDMKKAGVEPDLNAFNIMLNYCAQIGNHQKAFKYFEDLKVRQLNPDLDTYNALIAVFAPMAGHEFVYKVFEEMAECRIAPDARTFSILGKHKAGRAYLATATDRHLIYVDKK